MGKVNRDIKKKEQNGITMKTIQLFRNMSIKNGLSFKTKMRLKCRRSTFLLHLSYSDFLLKVRVSAPYSNTILLPFYKSHFCFCGQTPGYQHCLRCVDFSIYQRFLFFCLFCCYMLLAGFQLSQTFFDPLSRWSQQRCLAVQTD